jgi:hypothetical protein
MRCFAVSNKGAIRLDVDALGFAKAFDFALLTPWMKLCLEMLILITFSLHCGNVGQLGVYL